MNVLSLCDGISCGQQALKELGIPVAKYYASEVDKYAISVTQKNFPDTIQIGDITKVKGADLPKIDLIIGGTPCQGFSFAGKQLAFDDPRSKLFFEYVRICKEVLPNYFFLENVRMKKEYLDVITETMGVEPILINSALVSAQNRRRYCWTNIPGICQPEDKGIMLKEVVHEYADTELSEKELNYMLRSNIKWHKEGACRMTKNLMHGENKAYCVTANIHKGVPYNAFYNVLNEYIVPFDKTLQILDKEVQRGKVGYFRKDSQANRVYYIHGKACTLCGDAGGGAAKMSQYLFGCIEPNRLNKYQNGQRFSEGKKFYMLTTKAKHGILIEGYIRKLTPIECERLQTLPDNYTEGCSNSQRYKMLGNSWTCEVIKHLFKGLNK